jgi:hypothetical protein
MTVMTPVKVCSALNGQGRRYEIPDVKRRTFAGVLGSGRPWRR